VISSLRGTVLQAAGATAIVEVGGVGFAVAVTPDHARSLRVGAEAFLHTSLVVREDSLSLFGFADAQQLEVFELLNGVTGVGPKSAMGVLAVLSPDAIAAAVESDDDKVFRAVSGIGPKTAKLIVVSLTGKVTPAAPVAARGTARGGSMADDVVAALVGLGWPDRAARAAVAETADAESGGDMQDLLRRALAHLGPAQNPRTRA
jgi:holliday junction DNA helicase RuvA